MPVLNIRISKKEKELIEKVAKFEGKSLTEYLRDLIYDDLEYLEDLEAIKEYEKNKEKAEFIPFEEIAAECLWSLVFLFFKHIYVNVIYTRRYFIY